MTGTPSPNFWRSQITQIPWVPSHSCAPSHQRQWRRQDEVVASPRLAPLATTVPGRPWRRSKTASRGRSAGRYRDAPPRTAPALPKVTFKGSDPLKEAWISALDPLGLGVLGGKTCGKMRVSGVVHEGSCWVEAAGAEAFGAHTNSCVLARWVIDRTRLHCGSVKYMVNGKQGLNQPVELLRH